MPGAIIAVDQERPDAVSYGSPGVARKDLWQNRPITLRSTAAGTGSYAWTLLTTPPGSAATVTNTEAQNASLTLDMGGSYRIQLVTDGGGAGNIQVLVLAVTFDTDGHVLMRGWRLPAYGEVASEDNFEGNDRGFAPDFEYIFGDIAAALNNIHPPVSATEVTVGHEGSGADFIADGVNDDVAINAAIASIAGVSGRPAAVFVLPGDYNLNSPVFGKSNVTLRGAGQDATRLRVGASFQSVEPNHFVIGAQGQQATNVGIMVSADAARGDTSITVTPSGELGNVQPRAFLLLFSNAVWGAAPNGTQQQGEYVRVKAVDTTAGVISLYGMLRDDYLVTNGSQLLQMSFVENFVIEDLSIAQLQALGTRNNAVPLVGFHKTRSFLLQRCRVHDNDGPGVALFSSLQGRVLACDFHDFTDDAVNERYGYGVIASGATEGIVVANNTLARGRHVFTTGAVPALNDGTQAVGIVRGINVTGNAASHCTAAVYATGPAAEDITFSGNAASNSDGFGFFVRGRACHVVGNTVEWCSQGIKAGSNNASAASGRGVGTAIVGNTLRYLRKGIADYAVGISLGNTDHCAVQGNTVLACDGAGVELRAGAHFNVIEGNTFIDCNVANNREDDPEATTIQYGSMDVAYLEGGRGGLAASLGFSGVTVTATGLDGLTADVVGDRILISGAGASGNNGVFVITDFVSATSVRWENALGSADPATSAVHWAVESVCDNVVANNVARNTPEVSANDASMVGHAKYFLRSRPADGGPVTNFRNIIKNNTALNMEQGVLLLGIGNYVAGNAANETTPGALVSGAPLDSMFYAAPAPGVPAMDALTGHYYVRSIATGVWSPILIALNDQVLLPAADFAFTANTVAPTIHQLPTASSAGQALTVAGQDGNVTGGDLALHGGGGASSGVVRLGPAGVDTLIVGQDIEITAAETVNRATATAEVRSTETNTVTSDGDTHALLTFTLDSDAVVVIDIEVEAVSTPSAYGSRWFKKTRGFLNNNGTISDGVERLIDSETLGTPSQTWTLAIERTGNTVFVNANSAGEGVRWYVLSQRIRVLTAVPVTPP